MTRTVPLIVLVALLLAACLSDSPRVVTTVRSPTVSRCPWEAPAPPRLPFQRPEHELAAFWEDRSSNRGSVVLTPEQIQAHNDRVRGISIDGWQRGRWDLRELRFDPQRLRLQLTADVEALQQVAAEGKRVLADGGAPDQLIKQLRLRVERLQPVDEIRVVTRSTALRCYPGDQGIYESARETAFDLGQCAQLRLGEPVRVFATGEHFWYVWSTYASGFVKPSALTPPLSPDEASAFLAPKKFVVFQRDQTALWATSGKTDRPGSIVGIARLGLHLPLLAEQADRLKVSLPTPEGISEAWVLTPDSVSVGYPPLTRQALFDRAFELLNSPYGWGGIGGHRDCSRLLMDLFGAFGVLLPRNSKRQSVAGTRHVEVDELDRQKKVEAIESASARAVVLLYLPGHIMLYLGKDRDHLYALHQFSGYLVPCKGGGETMVRVNRATVTSLDLGQGSTRKSFIERITRLVLLEPPLPGDRPQTVPEAADRGSR